MRRGNSELGDAVVAEKRIRVRGLEIVYDEVGGSTRLFLLVHGYTGFRKDFETQLPALGAHAWCVAPDLRGHGQSARAGASEHYRFAEAAADLVALLDALEVDRCDVLGHSMGGMVVLRAALAHPERFASLVLMDTSPATLDGIPRDAFQLAWKLAREQGMERLQPILRARAADDPTRSPADRRLEAEWGERYWERHRARMTAMDPEAYAGFGAEILDQESVAERLGEIACPTTVIVGEEDRPFVEPSQLLAARIPDAELVVVGESGHQPQLENPPAWLDAVVAHLQRARDRA